MENICICICMYCIHAQGHLVQSSMCVCGLPVSDGDTLLVNMLSVMTLKTLRENIIGITIKQKWNTLVIIAWKTHKTHIYLTYTPWDQAHNPASMFNWHNCYATNLKQKMKLFAISAYLCKAHETGYPNREQQQRRLWKSRRKTPNYSTLYHLKQQDNSVTFASAQQCFNPNLPI